MGYGYPNKAFSVILNVENNPWGEQSPNISYNDMLKKKAGVASLESALDIALNRVLKIYNTQLGLYKQLEQEIKQANPNSNKTLQQILNESMGNFKVKTDIDEKAKDQQKLEQAQQDLRVANRNFQQYFQMLIANAAQLTTQEDVERLFQNAENAIKELQAAFDKAAKRNDEIGEDIRKRIDRIMGKGTSNQNDSPVSFSKGANGELILNGVSGNAQRKFQEYQTLLKQAEKFGKGEKGWRSGRISQDVTKFSNKWRTIEQDLKNILAKDLEGKFNEAGIEQLMSLVVKALVTGKPIEAQSVQKSTSLAQESGYMLEGVASTALQGAFEQIFKDGLSEVFVSGSSVSEHTRIMFRLKQNIGTKDKKKIKDTLEEVNKGLQQKYQGLIEAFEALDKIDDYITLTFKKDGNKKSAYTIAFSDKLYKDINNISILTGTHSPKERAISGASTLLNSQDLLSKIGSSADAFIFAALNASSASIFYDPNTQAQLTKQLQELLMTFIFDVAYNPESFVQQVLGEEIGKAKVLYCHRIGAQVVPAFIILRNILTTFERIQTNLQTESMVKVNLSFDDTPASSYIETIQSSSEYKTGNHYNKNAWAYVATQVANNTLLNIHLNLLPAALDISSDWSALI